MLVVVAQTTVATIVVAVRVVVMLWICAIVCLNCEWRKVKCFFSEKKEIARKISHVCNRLLCRRG